MRLFSKSRVFLLLTAGAVSTLLVVPTESDLEGRGASSAEAAEGQQRLEVHRDGLVMWVAASRRITRGDIPNLNWPELVRTLPPAPLSPVRLHPGEMDPTATDISGGVKAVPSRFIARRRQRRVAACVPRPPGTSHNRFPPYVAGPFCTKQRALPSRTVGKVIVRDPGFQCTGTSVTSQWDRGRRRGNRSLVWTAAHCLYDAQRGEFYHPRDWYFIPAYSRGKTPYGVWRARSLLIARAYKGDQGLDFGAAIMSRSRTGVSLARRVGVQGFAWNYSAKRAYLQLGYPGNPPFNGKALYYCNSRLAFRLGRRLGVGCDFTAGSSGGPWLIGFRRRTGFGYVASVVSAGPSAPPLNIGPYQGTIANWVRIRAAKL
jgi:hypothetical protein